LGVRLLALSTNVRLLGRQELYPALPPLDAIEAAFIPLTHLPMIGRHVEEGLRELNIEFGRSGYFALYDFDQDIDTVVILAIRHQREKDYK
jgi:plasmid stabilization system protein ParE